MYIWVEGVVGRLGRRSDQGVQVYRPIEDAEVPVPVTGVVVRGTDDVVVRSGPRMGPGPRIL